MNFTYSNRRLSSEEGKFGALEMASKFFIPSGWEFEQGCLWD